MLQHHFVASALLVFATLSTGPLGLHAKSSAQAIPLDLTAPAAQLSPALTAKDPAMLKGATKLLVSNFRVVLISESDATGTASAGLGASGSARQTVFYKLANLEPAKLEAMADAAIVSWQESLKVAGYDVLPTSALHGQAGAEKLGVGSSLARFQMIETGGTIAMMVTPAGVPIKLPLGAIATDEHGRKIESVVATGADVGKVAAATGKGGMLGKFGAIGGKAAGLTKTVKGMGSVTGAIGDAGAISKLSEQLGAALVDVTLVINFVDLETSGGGFLERLAGSSEASVKGTVQPTFVANETSLSFVNGNARSSVVLTRPVVLAGNAILEIRDATTAMDKASNISGAVVSGAIALQNGGGVNSSKVNRKEAVASPNYGEIVGGNIAMLGKAMAEAMRAK